VLARKIEWENGCFRLELLTNRRKQRLQLHR
jgi:hypothetical protein